MAIHELKEQIGRLPEQPGVYLYFNADGDTIYVGKARALRDRVRNYLGAYGGDPKTDALLNEVARLESRSGGATLTRAGAASESADSFQALTENLLGVPLDPDAIAGWLHGAKPGNAPGDWKVTVDETQRAGTVDLARRITATRGDVVVRLVVDEYRALPE